MIRHESPQYFDDCFDEYVNSMVALLAHLNLNLKMTQQSITKAEIGLHCFRLAC